MDKNNSQTRPICLLCKQHMNGRSDKKFCNSACRNEYHNAKRLDNLKVLRAVNKTLRRNFKILHQAWICGEHELASSVLIKRGFNMNYFTSIQTLNNGTTYKFCYDIGFSIVNNNTIRILKKE
jgi:hypothetical protein